jgi:cell fate regulator YaaT (PSP1 superfamily)
MAHLIEVAFTGNRKGFYLWEGDAPPALKAAVIVDADRGEDLGHVHATGALAEVRCRGCAHGCGTTTPTERALRLATDDERSRWQQLQRDAEVARRAALEQVKQHRLVMKISDAEWQFDGKKLTLYFTSEKRVDFRALVRDLAAQFRARIELKQIGVRDEAKRLSGVGRCGREYCSSSWLPDLRPVNLSVAKDQKLSLNPTQISGACGRLMCCLRYEHEFYVQQRKRFPKEGKILLTKQGEARVLANDIFNERVTLRNAEGEARVVALADLRRELDELAEAVGLSGGFSTPAAGVPALAPDGPAFAPDLADVSAGTEEFDAGHATAAHHAELDELTADHDDDDAADDEATAAPPTGASTSPDADAARTRRRRGRRGGRRGRGPGGPSESPSPRTPS